MQNKNANQVLIDLIDLLNHYLIELSDIHDSPTQQFAYGEKTAYTECLEILSQWERAKENGLEDNVETIFPL